ncbi:hypothetical protein CEXT_181531 [Caerostris extrusa]|uniref:Uncharacterized protein n=1 Tax=Caerostris extrusa TaxID=172846 RepID=A0AAV4RKM7_CAEEX|nr:hypothetical protein CEXT_181531 [Caerostris extrusa]
MSRTRHTPPPPDLQVWRPRAGARAITLVNLAVADRLAITSAVCSPTKRGGGSRVGFVISWRCLSAVANSGSLKAEHKHRGRIESDGQYNMFYRSVGPLVV